MDKIQNHVFLLLPAKTFLPQRPSRDAVMGVRCCIFEHCVYRCRQPISVSYV